MFYRFLVLLAFLPAFVVAQPPKVPAKLDFANLKLRITEEARKEIQEDVDRLRRSPMYFDKQVEKAKSYFPIIERVFREENLPEDFKFLVLQESGLVSDAVSSSNAVGFWQFKDFTAAEMGLRIDRHIDERMNIESSSRGAARYLKKNNNSFFDNWLMSLQAYQMGPGAALKVGADKHRGAKSMTINKKTYWYVKKYLAHKIAYEDAIKGEGKLKLLEHRSSGNETLSDIAELYRVDSDEVKAYNKWLKKGKIPGDKAYSVIVPTTNASMVTLASVSSNPPAKVGNTVTVTKDEITNIDYYFQDASEFPKIEDKQGLKEGKVVTINGLPGLLAGEKDKTTALAAKGNVELGKFLKFNDLSINDALVTGQVYYLKSKRGKAKTHYHIAREGESLWDISQKYAVKLKKLRAKNRMNAQEKVKMGRVVWLRYIRPSKVAIEYRDIGPKPPTPVIVNDMDSAKAIVSSTPGPNSATIEEVEAPGHRPTTFLEKLDSLERVTEDRGDSSVSITPPPTLVTEIQADQEILDADTLSRSDTSQKIGEMPAQEALDRVDSVLQTHVVSKGETYYAISKIYDVRVMDVLKWNNLNINDKLGIGQRLEIYTKTTKPPGQPLEPQSTSPGSEISPFTVYTVAEGDTLYSIARSHQVSIEELMQWNDKKDMGVQLGEKLKIQKAIDN